LPVRLDRNWTWPAGMERLKECACFLKGGAGSAEGNADEPVTRKLKVIPALVDVIPTVVRALEQ
jgi:hypothetical protein